MHFLHRHAVWRPSLVSVLVLSCLLLGHVKGRQCPQLSPPARSRLAWTQLSRGTRLRITETACGSLLYASIDISGCFPTRCCCLTVLSLALDEDAILPAGTQRCTKRISNRPDLSHFLRTHRTGAGRCGAPTRSISGCHLVVIMSAPAPCCPK